MRTGHKKTIIFVLHNCVPRYNNVQAVFPRASPGSHERILQGHVSMWPSWRRAATRAPMASRSSREAEGGMMQASLAPHELQPRRSLPTLDQPWRAQGMGAALAGCLLG